MSTAQSEWSSTIRDDVKIRRWITYTFATDVKLPEEGRLIQVSAMTNNDIALHVLLWNWSLASEWRVAWTEGVQWPNLKRLRESGDQDVYEMRSQSR